MRGICTTVAALALVVSTATADLSEADFIVHSNVSALQGFNIAPLGPALDFEATRLELAAQGLQVADIAHISGIFNGNWLWIVRVTSDNNWYLKGDSGQEVGHRYAVKWYDHGGKDQLWPNDVTVMGYLLKPNRKPDPKDDGVWSSSKIDGGMQVVQNMESEPVSEYNASMRLFIQGAQQWKRGLYQDALTVTIMVP